MNVAVKAVKHAAPGPYLGFALQPGNLQTGAPGGPYVSARTYKSSLLSAASSRSAYHRKSAVPAAPEESQFRLYVTPRRKGVWAQALSDATKAADVVSLTAEIKAKHAKLKKPPSLRLVRAVLS
jgi:hypothetical protein